MNSFIENNDFISDSFEDENIKYERVNFYDPETIMGYASEILHKIDELKDAYKKFDDDYEIDYDAQEKIKNINFKKRVEENAKRKKEAKQSKKLLSSNFLLKGLNSLFNIDEKIESRAKTNGDLYREFVGNIDDIRADIVERRNCNIKNIRRTKEFLIVFEKYVNLLEEAINVGYQDIEDFENSVINPMEENGESTSKLRILKGSVAYFKKVLVGLKECLVVYNTEIEEFVITNMGTMEVVSEQDTFIRSYMSIVRGQGALIITIERQKNDIDQMASIKEEINETIVEYSKLISENAKRINELSTENFIKDKSFKDVNNALNQCVDLIIKTDQSREKIFENRSKHLDEISATSKKYRNFIQSITLPIGNPVLPESINPDNTIDNNELDEGFQKKLKR